MISGGLADGSTSATEMFERLVGYLEGAQDSFIENCTWLVETLIGKSSHKRMTISLVDFTLGLSVGSIEPMTIGISTEIAEQIANVQDKSSQRAISYQKNNNNYSTCVKREDIV